MTQLRPLCSSMPLPVNAKGQYSHWYWPKMSSGNAQAIPRSCCVCRYRVGQLQHRATWCGAIDSGIDGHLLSMRRRPQDSHCVRSGASHNPSGHTIIETSRCSVDVGDSKLGFVRGQRSVVVCYQRCPLATRRSHSSSEAPHGVKTIAANGPSH